MLQGIGDSRTATEEELKQLRREENDILEEIFQHEGSMAEKIRRLAKIMEERINYGDQLIDYLVHEISTQIRRALLSHVPPIVAGYHVNDYLDEKYKDPDHAQLAKIKAAINNLEYRTTRRCESIEQCSAHELPALLEQIRNEANERDRLAAEAIKIATEKKREIEAVRQRARALGLSHLLDEEYRDPISERDYRYEIPEYFGLKELNEEVTLQGNREVAALTKFYNEKYPECPATERQAAWKYANAIRVHANLMETINEDKWSGDKTFWFDREFWNNVQSAHKAGNSTLFPTTLCARCSSNIENDPKDFHRMKYWRPSPTGYICDCCGGTEVLPRENSREQVGDKEPNVLRDAIDVINHEINYPEVYLDWRTRFKNPAIYARKKAISNEFRIASFGKEKIVVPKPKKAK